jgi:hypothetical protein
MSAAGSEKGKRRRRRELPLVHEAKRGDAYQLFSAQCPVETMICFVTDGYIFEKESGDVYQIETHGTYHY